MTTLRERVKLTIPEEFVSRLTPDEVQLINIRDELYSGMWENMIKDLMERCNRRPYVPTVFGRIQRDLPVIKSLRDYEARYGVNLSDLLDQFDVRAGLGS